jgi:hypothetical protein
MQIFTPVAVRPDYHLRLRANHIKLQPENAAHPFHAKTDFPMPLSTTARSLAPVFPFPARMSDPSLSSFICSVADLLRGDYKQSEYGKVSRVEVVRWQLAIDKYIKAHGYKIGTLVAFSDEVSDQVSGPDGFTENSKMLNPNLKGRDIREAFKGAEYQILLVANKFQTGKDQPLLCGMYVDKRLAGIQAVQTLSRLNRAHPGKDTTYVVDFVNDTAEVLAAFKTTTPRRNFRRRPIRIWFIIYDPNWMPPGTTMTSRWIAWWRWS